MKLHYLALIASLAIPFQLVNADIASDLDANMNVDAVLQNALDQGLSIEQAVAKMVQLAPESAGDIVAAATSLAPRSAETIAAAAISAGADPTVVTAATAAGRVPAGPIGGPGLGGRRGLGGAPSVGGGGTTASPS